MCCLKMLWRIQDINFKEIDEPYNKNHDNKKPVSNKFIPFGNIYQS